MKWRVAQRWAVWLTLIALGIGTRGLAETADIQSYVVPAIARAAEAPAAPESTVVEAPELPSVETIRANLQARWETLEDVSFEWVFEWFNQENGKLEDRSRFSGVAVMPHFIRLTVHEPEFMAGAIYIYRGDRNQVIDYNPLTEFVGCMSPEAFARSHGIVLGNENGEFSLEQFLGISEESLNAMTVVGSETIDGVLHVIVKLGVEDAAEQLATHIEDIEGLDDIENFDELLQTVVAWIDTERWIITKVETWDVEGTVTTRQQLTNVKINLGTTVNQVVQLRANNRNCN